MGEEFLAKKNKKNYFENNLSNIFMEVPNKIGASEELK